jgi:hypothetical protein
MTKAGVDGVGERRFENVRTIMSESGVGIEAELSSIQVERSETHICRSSTDIQDIRSFN